MLVTSKGKAKTTKELIDASIGVLIDALESGHSEVLTAYLSAMAKFHYYSFGNVLLIAMQKRNATRVAGMYSWNQLGRRIRRGEKGIMIFAPMVSRRRKKEPEEQNEAQAEAKTTDRNTDGRLVGFRPVYVWDVSQTEGAELPKLDEVQGNPAEQLPRLIEFVKSQDIKFEYSENLAPARGLSYGGLIRLLPSMTPAEEFSTLVHELAHEMIHKAERRTVITKTVKETEAESVAFVVSKAIGLESGGVSADYIQLYHGNAALLQESLEVVQRTAAVILGAIAPEVAEEEPQAANVSSEEVR
jgi:antirestriction protein ArdC